MTLNSSSWQSVAIERLCLRITSGGTPLRRNQNFYEGGSIPWVKTGELKDWYIEDTEERITEEAIEHSSAKLFPKETVLMAMYGDGRTITSLGILRREAASNQACCAMIADPSACHPLFLFYSLKSHRQALLKLAYGGAQRNLNAKTIRQFQIPVPSLSVQQAIVSILSAYDDLIENNTRRIKILEEMAQMLYREWFVTYRFPDDQTIEMVESELGRIPEGWKVETLPHRCSKVIDGTHDSPPPVEDGFFLVTGKHFTSGFIDFDGCYRISADEHEKVMKRSKPEAGDILFSNIGTLGSIAQVPNQPEFSIKNVALLKPKTAAHSTFMFCHFRLPESLEVLHQKASGTSQKFWSLQFLRSLPLVTPPGDAIVLFHHEVAPLLSYRLLLNEKNRNLRTTRDLLLPKLISGEILVDTAEEVMEQTA